MPVLVVGTRNPKKREEIIEILAGSGIEVRDLTHYPGAPEVVEDGKTFEDNARKKATETARHVQQWVLAEDSGLVVPALNGRPGVCSARYAGRAAYYVCVAALADPEGNVRAVTEGRCHGVIVKDYRGTGGFGYDPLFLIPEYHRTFGELSARAKHAISHRARALERMRPELRRLLGAPGA